MQANQKVVVFKSDISQDRINLHLFHKSHRAFLNIKSFESVTENIKLINDIILHLKKEDIKWVICKLDEAPNVPQNTVWYRNKYNDNIVCHIEDFERFYSVNMNKFIKMNIVFIDEGGKDNESEDGWITIVDKKKFRKNKLDKIKREINDIMTGDWNAIEK